MGVASLWDQCTDTTTGEIVTSFTMLTVKADGHPVMGRFHRPGDEKCSAVVLETRQFGPWLRVDMAAAWTTMKCPDDDLLIANAERQVGQSVQGGLF